MSVPPEDNTPIDLVLEISGPEEVVFDWSNDHCEEFNIPDITAIAFRDADGMVNLTTGKMKSREGTVVDADNLVDDMVEAGTFEVTFSAVNLPSALYLYGLQYGEQIEVKKMLLAK